MDVSGGVVNVNAGSAYDVGNTDVGTGTLSVADGVTANTGTGSLGGGGLGFIAGAGTFVASEAFVWNSGTQRGSGNEKPFPY